ncbi:MAG TPA: hypothetical protein VFO10_24480 [Oligoflexus sp.]|uniref:hypothetical protein n=1 Tax=Oligoflexus sp. TaxID=1971216 RepID=UPI002D80495C|nr:hypothetical protein [Oligoflexus sp.]HET9240444.1 hypothetical protein [Oligoflexus sp.]
MTTQNSRLEFSMRIRDAAESKLSGFRFGILLITEFWKAALALLRKAERHQDHKRVKADSAQNICK